MKLFPFLLKIKGTKFKFNLSYLIQLSKHQSCRHVEHYDLLCKSYDLFLYDGTLNNWHQKTYLKNLVRSFSTIVFFEFMVHCFVVVVVVVVVVLVFHIFLL